MNIKMKAVKRKHRKAKERRRVIAAESRKNARSKTRERWLKTGLLPRYRV
jgi:hypothetical protein